MSLMLDKLLKGQKVEWKKLNEIAVKISSGGTPKTGVAEYYNGDIPWLRTQEVNFDEIWETGIKITEEGLNNSSAKIIPANCVIVAMYGATVGKVGLNKIPMATNQACANIQVDENLANYRYVFHFLMSQYQYIKSLGTGSQTNINAQTVKNLEIPIPPLDVQAKIVKILDAFTALTAELTAELTMREKQYHYYRDKLLTFSDDVGWVQIGDVATIKGRIGFRGYTVEDFVDEGEGAISLSPGNMINGRFDFKNCRYISWEKYEESPEIQIQKDEVIFVKTGSTAGKVAYVSHLPEKSTLNPQLVVFKNLKCNSKFLFYLLNLNNIQKQISALAKGAIPNISQTALSKIKIPLPSIDEQNRIVSILNKLDTITNSITEGLPKEIALRQQQYEYYREQLLDFPKE